MLDWIFIVMMVAFGSGGGSGDSLSSGMAAAAAPEPAIAAETDQPASASGFQAEPQVPTGQFTTATEIKQLMELTKGSWLAISAQPGNDLLFATQIWSWRCGLLQMKMSVNGGPMEEWPLPPCHEGTNAPNAIIDSDGLPFKMFGAGEIQTVAVELLYDDLTTTSASYTRPDILMP